MSTIMKLAARFAQSPARCAEILAGLVETPPTSGLTAYKAGKPVPSPTGDPTRLSALPT